MNIFKEQYGTLFKGKSDKTFDERYKNMFTQGKKELQEENYSPKSKNTLKKIMKIVALGTAGTLLLIPLVGCGGSNGNGNGNGVEVKILPTIYATHTLEGTDAIGTVRYVGNSKDVTVNLGQQADLGSAPEGENRSFTIYVIGDGNLESIFNNANLKGTQKLYTDVLKKEGFNLNEFVERFLRGNTNDRYNQNKVDASFNPDIEGTGKRLDSDWIKATKDAINKIKEHSNGFIQTITYDEDGNFTLNDLPPPDGNGKIFYNSRPEGSVQNATYPNFDGPVDAFALLFNPERSIIPAVSGEVIDAFFGDNQGYMPKEFVWKWIEFSFNRPVYNYSIYLDREEHEGFRGTIDTSASNQYVNTLQTTGNSIFTSPFSPYSEPTLTFTPAKSKERNTDKSKKQEKKKMEIRE